MAIYYTAVGGALTVTLSEKRAPAGDRPRTAPHGKGAGRAGDGPASKPGQPLAAAAPGSAPTPPCAWTAGSSKSPTPLGRRQYEQLMQTHCWNNLPILNEWKRLYPDRDPVEVHRAVWGVELVCPGGGKYVWNEKFQTMESTVYGSPAAPKEGPPAPPVLSSLPRPISA